MNLCVLFYPEDDQAQVEFIDFTVFSASTDPDDIEVSKAIQRALFDPDKIATVKAQYVCEKTQTGQITPPCQVDGLITIYFD